MISGTACLRSPELLVKMQNLGPNRTIASVLGARTTVSSHFHQCLICQVKFDSHSSRLSLWNLLSSQTWPYAWLNLSFHPNWNHFALIQRGGNHYYKRHKAQIHFIRGPNPRPKSTNKVDLGLINK